MATRRDYTDSESDIVYEVDQPSRSEVGFIRRRRRGETRTAVEAVEHGAAGGRDTVRQTVIPQSTSVGLPTNASGSSTRRRLSQIPTSVLAMSDEDEDVEDRSRSRLDRLKEEISSLARDMRRRSTELLEDPTLQVASGSSGSDSSEAEGRRARRRTYFEVAEDLYDPRDNDRRRDRVEPGPERLAMASRRQLGITESCGSDEDVTRKVRSA